MKCNCYTNLLLRRMSHTPVKNRLSFDYFNKLNLIPFVLKIYFCPLDRNQSDSRRSKLKSCKNN